MRAAAILGLAGLLFTNEAMAADYLRGSTYEGPVESYNWAGVYVGGQVGYGTADFDFGTALNVPGKSVESTSYGGFMGYNAGWDQAVVSIEGNYNHASLTATSSNATALVPATLTATGKVSDYGTLRFRAGYAAGYFMPYLMAGLAVGNVDLTVEDTIAATVTRRNATSFGYMLGAGVDIGLLPNLFLRGEYEFVQLSPVNGVTVQSSTLRTAVALKF